jgi:hypothetical protein
MLTQDQIHHNANRRRLLKSKSRQTGVFLGLAFFRAIVLVFMLGIGCIAGGWPELGLTICSIGVMAVFVRWLVARGHLVVGLLLITFLLGYLLSWCVGFLGYRYVLPWRGFEADLLGRHFVLTATLVLLAVCGTCLGGWAAIHLVRPVRNSMLFRSFPRQQLRPQLVVLGAVFLTYQILWFSMFGFNARWDIGSQLQTGSDLYWVAGFRTPMLAFYALLGISLKRPLWSASNLWLGGLVLANVGLNSLTGGRGSAIEPFVLFMTGALFSPIGWRALARLCVLALPILIAIVIVIGWARGSSAFGGGSVTDKITAINKVVHTGSKDTADESDPANEFFSRVFEPSAQVVIDDDTDSDTRFGWLNFDRLPFLFVPQFVYPEKLPLTDGFERLVKFHGYQYSDYTSSPLTFLADAYERFGVTGVIGFHFAAGMILVWLGRLVLMARWQLLGAMLLVCFAKAALGFYAVSVLEFVSATFYGFLRDTVVITLIFTVGWYLQGNTGSGRPAKTLTKNKRKNAET